MSQLFQAPTLEDLKLELQRAFDAPGQPRPLYTCNTASLPPAATYPFCQVFNTDLNKAVTSNGVAWV